VGKTKGTVVLKAVKVLRSRKDEARAHLSESLHHYLEDRIMVASWYPEEDFFGLLCGCAALFPGGDSAFEMLGAATAQDHADGMYADIFKRDLAPAIAKTANRVTLYASSDDEALVLSKKLHGYPRAGDSGGQLVVVPGVETIDVSQLDTGLLGHSYYGNNDTVLADMFYLLHESRPASQRRWLRPQPWGNGQYWVLVRNADKIREASRTEPSVR